MSNKILRILVIRIDFFGDLLCTTPLLSALKQAHPDCFLAVLASPYNRDAISGNPHADEIFEYVYSKQTERNRRPGILHAIVDRIRLILRLRANKFDYIIIPNGGMHKNSIQFARWVGAPHVLFNTAETEFDDRRTDHCSNRTIDHEVLAGFRVARELLGAITPGPLQFAPTDMARRNVKGKLAGLHSPSVALNFSARVVERSWPYHRWCELAASLAKNHSVVILGVPAMWEDPEFKNAMNTVGLTGTRGVYPLPTANFVELAAALGLCDTVICCDGGPVHIAAAQKKPVVVLFENRPEKYLRWYPWAVPHQIVVSQTGTSVDTIAVADVLAAHEKLRASVYT